MSRALVVALVVALGCGGETRAPTSSKSPSKAAARAPDEGAYYLVGPSGARPCSADGLPIDGALLLPGFGVRAVEERDLGGRRLVRTTGNRWLRRDELTPARPSRFAGTRLDGSLAGAAWVVEEGAPVYQTVTDGQPHGLVARRRRLDALTVIPGEAAPGLVHTTQGWLRARDVAVATPSPARPADLLPNDRWIDVDLASQTLVAYEGDRARYATLVSAGVGTPGSPIATPPGTFRIRAKLPTADMDNAGHTGVVPYAYEAVPFVQYFTGAMALHAALWHDRFGHPASHGCVNLAPADAAWLYDFTRVGTIVRVR